MHLLLWPMPLPHHAYPAMPPPSGTLQSTPSPIFPAHCYHLPKNLLSRRWLQHLQWIVHHPGGDHQCHSHLTLHSSFPRSPQEVHNLRCFFSTWTLTPIKFKTAPNQPQFRIASNSPTVPSATHDPSAAKSPLSLTAEGLRLALAEARLFLLKYTFPTPMAHSSHSFMSHHWNCEWGRCPPSSSVPLSDLHSSPTHTHTHGFFLHTCTIKQK